MPPPPLPTTTNNHVTVFPDLPPPRKSSNSSSGGNVHVFSPPPPTSSTSSSSSRGGPPRAVVASLPPPPPPLTSTQAPAPQQQQDRFTERAAAISVLASSRSSAEETNPPSRPPRGNRPQPPPRDPVVAQEQPQQTLPTPNGLCVEDPSPSADVSPALSEAPTFGFPTRLLRTSNGGIDGGVEEEGGKVEELRHERFSALGLPIGHSEGKREGGRIVHDESGKDVVAVEESSLLPTPVASPPPIFVQEEDRDQLQPSLPIVDAQDKDVLPSTSNNERDLDLDSSSAPPTASTLVSLPTPSSSIPTTAVERSEPSVPHTELLHLRSLLAHASTADEARLLVNSLLSRWGVPYPALPESEAGDAVEERKREREREEQVGRVHGWLLEESSGREEEEVAEEEESDESAVVAEEKETKLAPEQEAGEEEEGEEEIFESPSPKVEQGVTDEAKEEVAHHQPAVVAAVRSNLI